MVSSVDARQNENGYLEVDSDVLLQITRFRLRSAWALPLFFCLYLRVKAQSKQVNGLLAHTFGIEGLRTCYTLSLWRSMKSILEFNEQVIEHVRVANLSFDYIERINGRPHLWSAQFRLAAVSSNLRWNGVDILNKACAPPTTGPGVSQPTQSRGTANAP